MLAVIPSRTDPTRQLLPQALKNTLFLSQDLEGFVRDLTRKTGSGRAAFAFTLAGLGLLSTAFVLGPEGDQAAWKAMTLGLGLAGAATLAVALAIPLRDV